MRLEQPNITPELELQNSIFILLNLLQNCTAATHALGCCCVYLLELKCTVLLYPLKLPLRHHLLLSDAQSLLSFLSFCTNKQNVLPDNRARRKVDLVTSAFISLMHGTRGTLFYLHMHRDTGGIKGVCERVLSLCVCA
jgi:hypothetical protein